MKILAKYEDGVLKPFEKPDLEEGEEVEIELKKKNIKMKGKLKNAEFNKEDFEKAQKSLFKAEK